MVFYSIVMPKEVVEDLRKSGWSEEQIHAFVQKQMTGGNEKPIVIVSGITKLFGTQEVLSNVSFDIYPKEVLGVIGMSGVGKSTLLNIIAGLVEPQSGRVKRKKGVRYGFSTQFPSFYPSLTVLENLDYFASLADLNSKSRKPAIAKVMGQVGLGSYTTKKAGRLSGGQKKRLDLALSLLHQPDVLLLDEPTADLDPISRERLWQLIKTLRTNGMTIVLCSHLLEEIEPVCDRICILHDKKIVDIGRPDAIKDAQGVHYVVRLELQSGNYSAFTAAHGAQFKQEGQILVAGFTDGLQTSQFVSQILSQGDPVLHLSITPPSLKYTFEQKIA
jgi:ABC-2 type transport system ATP-binding protein